jgi:hypothetical protein
MADKEQPGIFYFLVKLSWRALDLGDLNPNSAAELATYVRKRRKPGAAKTQARMMSRPWVELGIPPRFVFIDLLYAPKPTRY